ncbi:MAG: hypothetical protein AAF127_03915 [Pseudomonadota bacterium]
MGGIAASPASEGYGTSASALRINALKAKVLSGSSSLAVGHFLRRRVLPGAVFCVAAVGLPELSQSGGLRSVGSLVAPDVQDTQAQTDLSPTPLISAASLPASPAPAVVGTREPAQIITGQAQPVEIPLVDLAIPAIPMGLRSIDPADIIAPRVVARSAQAAGSPIERTPAFAPVTPATVSQPLFAEPLTTGVIAAPVPQAAQPGATLTEQATPATPKAIAGMSQPELVPARALANMVEGELVAAPPESRAPGLVVQAKVIAPGPVASGDTSALKPALVGDPTITLTDPGTAVFEVTAPQFVPAMLDVPAVSEPADLAGATLPAAPDKPRPRARSATSLAIPRFETPATLAAERAVSTLPSASSQARPSDKQQVAVPVSSGASAGSGPATIPASQTRLIEAVIRPNGVAAKSMSAGSGITAATSQAPGPVPPVSAHALVAVTERRQLPSRRSAADIMRTATIGSSAQGEAVSSVAQAETTRFVPTLKGSPPLSARAPSDREMGAQGLGPQVLDGVKQALRLDVKDQLGTRVDGKIAGRVEFRQSLTTLEVRLGSLLDLLRDRYDSAQFERLAASSAGDVFMTVPQLREAGIPISYDPVYDEFNIGSVEYRPKAAHKVQMDQITQSERGAGPIAPIDQVIPGR